LTEFYGDVPPSFPNSVWGTHFPEAPLRASDAPNKTKTESTHSFFEQKETKATKKSWGSTARQILRSLRFLLFQLFSEVQLPEDECKVDRFLTI